MLGFTLFKFKPQTLNNFMTFCSAITNSHFFKYYLIVKFFKNYKNQSMQINKFIKNYANKTKNDKLEFSTSSLAFKKVVIFHSLCFVYFTLEITIKVLNFMVRRMINLNF